MTTGAVTAGEDDVCAGVDGHAVILVVHSGARYFSVSIWFIPSQREGKRKRTYSNTIRISDIKRVGVLALRITSLGIYSDAIELGVGDLVDAKHLNGGVDDGETR